MMEPLTGKLPWATPNLTILSSASTAAGGPDPSDGENDTFQPSSA